MDPNVTLKQLRELVGKYQDSTSLQKNWDAGATLSEIVKLFDALDEWLTRGGFPPNNWNGDLEAIIRKDVASALEGFHADRSLDYAEDRERLVEEIMKKLTGAHDEKAE